MSTDVLYTAVTRAKTHLYVIGDMVAFNKMIELGEIDESINPVVSILKALSFVFIKPISMIILAIAIGSIFFYGFSKNRYFFGFDASRLQMPGDF